MDVVLDWEGRVTAGTTPKQADLWRGTAAVCEGRVGERSIWAVLCHQGDRLFGDELFADLFAGVGRRSVPPRIVATVMVLQRLQGLSDREAVEAFCFDARWKYACGGLPFDYPASATRCWWTCGRGWLPRQGRSGSSRSPSRRPGRPGWSGSGGCWTPRRCTTRWRPWTPSRCWARPSAGCSPWPTSGWPPSCAGCWPVVTTTPARPSRRSTGTTRPPERRWSTRAPGTPTRCSQSCRAARCRRRWPRPPGCLAPSSARTSSTPATAASGSPAGLPPTG